MAIDSNSPLGQAENSNQSLAGFFNALSKHLADPTGTMPPPEFRDIVESLDYSELHRMTFVRSGDAASHENGAAIENVHQMAALTREYGMASKTKSDYYTDGAAEADRESVFYSNMKVFWVSMLSGNYKEGTTS